MAVDYKAIYDKMDWDVVYTATQLGVAAASLTAMSKRGMVEVINGKPKKYRKVFSPLSKILEAVQGRTSDYFFLHKENNPIGMLCSDRNGKIYDCWGNEYDVSEIVMVEVDGKEIFVGRKKKVVQCEDCIHKGHCAAWVNQGGYENCESFKKDIVR